LRVSFQVYSVILQAAIAQEKGEDMEEDIMQEEELLSEVALQ